MRVASKHGFFAENGIYEIGRPASLSHELRPGHKLGAAGHQTSTARITRMQHAVTTGQPAKLRQE